MNEKRSINEWYKILKVGPVGNMCRPVIDMLSKGEREDTPNKVLKCTRKAYIQLVRNAGMEYTLDMSGINSIVEMEEVNVDGNMYRIMRDIQEKLMQGMDIEIESDIYELQNAISRKRDVIERSKNINGHEEVEILSLQSGVIQPQMKNEIINLARQSNAHTVEQLEEMLLQYMSEKIDEIAGRLNELGNLNAKKFVFGRDGKRNQIKTIIQRNASNLQLGTTTLTNLRDVSHRNERIDFSDERSIKNNFELAPIEVQKPVDKEPKIDIFDEFINFKESSDEIIRRLEWKYRRKISGEERKQLEAQIARVQSPQKYLNKMYDQTSPEDRREMEHRLGEMQEKSNPHRETKESPQQ